MNAYVRHRHYIDTVERQAFIYDSTLEEHHSLTPRERVIGSVRILCAANGNYKILSSVQYLPYSMHVTVVYRLKSPYE
jgi:hypothetical protein